MKRPLHIALVHPFVWPEVRRGGERYVDDLRDWLSNAGHRVDIIAAIPAKGTVEHRDHMTSRRLRVPDSPWLERRGLGVARLFGVRAVPALLRRRYDVVHAFMPAAALAGRVAGQRTWYSHLGNPVPAWVHNCPGDARLMRAAVRAAQVTSVLSSAARERMQEFTGRRPVILAPGVRMREFPPDLTARAGPPKILFSGYLSANNKGLDVLLQAMPAVLDRHPGARLLLSGDGSPQWALATAPDPVRDAVDVLGPGSIADVASRYREATVTALPSAGEAFGLVLVESLASGTPVVGSAGEGMADIVDDRVGRLSPYRDADALARALIEAVDLAADERTPALCVERAALWDWADSIGPRHEEIYLRLLAGAMGAKEQAALSV